MKKKRIESIFIVALHDGKTIRGSEIRNPESVQEAVDIFKETLSSLSIPYDEVRIKNVTLERKEE